MTDDEGRAEGLPGGSPAWSPSCGHPKIAPWSATLDPAGLSQTLTRAAGWTVAALVSDGVFGLPPAPAFPGEVQRFRLMRPRSR